MFEVDAMIRHARQIVACGNFAHLLQARQAMSLDKKLEVSSTLGFFFSCYSFERLLKVLSRWIKVLCDDTAAPASMAFGSTNALVRGKPLKPHTKCVSW